MQDQIIDAVMARSIHVDAVRTHPLAAWVIVRPMAYVPPCSRAGIGRQPVTRCSDRRCDNLRDAR
jgi:hypothetical protein